MFNTATSFSLSELFRFAAKVSLDRVAEFLNDTELLDEFQETKGGAQLAEGISTGPEDPETVGFRDAAFEWSNDVEGSLTPSRRKFRLVIEDEVKFKKGINLIIGPTGSGKTSLLMALLGKYLFDSLLFEILTQSQAKCTSSPLGRHLGSAFRAIKEWRMLLKNPGYLTRR